MHLIGNSRNSDRFRMPGLVLRGGLVALGLFMLLGTVDAAAFVHLDFEQKYYRHPGRQVWDFSIVRPDSIYHIFYHTIHEQTPSAVHGDTIWCARSPDLVHWDDPTPVLTVGQGPWDAGAMWAPDVFRDDAKDRWVLAYTGADSNFNQTICLAYSSDLINWDKARPNPVAVPDTAQYVWDPAGAWSDFRDPFVYRQDGRWHMLATAKFRDLDGGSRGVIYHGTSGDLSVWTDVGPLFINDGATPARVLESPQYRIIGATHHLLFGEFDTIGTTVLSASDPSAWTMAQRVLLDYGYAPEIDEFDPGVHIFSRLANFQQPDGVSLGYVVRMDTLLTDPAGGNPSVHRPHPLEPDWIVHTGSANLASPTFGDNPLWRGEPSVGLVGNGYFGSGEYHQGPLSGRGAPGTMLGDGATGVAESFRFPITGNRMSLLVGGGYFPSTCFVALVDDADESILHLATGNGTDTMSLVTWDLTPYMGRTCYLTIVDLETSPGGHLNVDQIVESLDTSTAGDATPPATRPLWHRAAPNPFNPRLKIAFALAAATPCEVVVWNLRGHLVWRSGERLGVAGLNSVTWQGVDTLGRSAPAGTYLYGILVDGAPRASGKVALVK